MIDINEKKNGEILKLTSTLIDGKKRVVKDRGKKGYELMNIEILTLDSIFRFLLI